MADEDRLPLSYEERLIRASLEGGLRSVNHVDTFCGWLLAAGGAAAALIISNVDSVTKVVPIASVTLSFKWFMAALVLGVFEKLVAGLLESMKDSASATETEMMRVLREANTTSAAVDFLRVKHQIRDVLWQPWRALAVWGFKKGEKDPLWNAKFFVHLSHIQMYLFLSLAASFFLSFGVLVAGMSR